MTSRAFRLIAGTLAGVTAVAVATPPAHAQPDGTGVHLAVSTLAPMQPGQRGWISAAWVAERDVCDVKLTATGPGLRIRYPTGAYTSFLTASTLAAGSMDYTPLDVTVGAGASGPVEVTFTITYRQPAGSACSGTTAHQSVTATLPVTAPTGTGVLQKTTAVSVPQDTPTWTRIVFRGTARELAHFLVTLTPLDGLSVAYPKDAKSSGLDGGTSLTPDADDFASVRIDASGMTPGVYNMAVHADYTGGTYDGFLTVVVT